MYAEEKGRGERSIEDDDEQECFLSKNVGGFRKSDSVALLRIVLSG